MRAQRMKVAPAAHRQRGFLLVASLLLLLIITILAVTMFRSFSVQEKIAGNVREKQRALHVAEAAEQYAEWWLTSNGNNASVPITCAALLNANLNQGQICSNAPPLALDAGNVITLPWTINSVAVGVSYTPPSLDLSAVGGIDTFIAPPVFYIADMGPSADGLGELYQIDAAGYGGSNAAVSVIQSTYEVSAGVTNRGGL